MVKPYYLLGLDLGIGSLGWCILDIANKVVVDGGVHLWNIPQDSKTKESLAAARRSSRSTRRNIERTHNRKKHCLKLLQEQNLVPLEANAAWLQTGKKDKPTIVLRKEGLDRLLTDREWAQILYSICSRRGYIHHGKLDLGEKTGEDGKVAAAVKANQEKFALEEYRTVGEMLANQDRCRNRNGNYENCVTLDMILNEVRFLFEKQRDFGSAHASTEFEASYINNLTWQKKTTDYDKRVYEKVGRCSYFPEEKRAAKAATSAELCRAWEKVNHCNVLRPDGTKEKLPFEIKKWIVETLFSPIALDKNKKCRVTYASIRKMMDLDSRSRFEGIDESKEKSASIDEPKAWAKMREKLSPELMTRLHEDTMLADAIAEALTFASGLNSLKEQLDPLDLNDDEKEEIFNIPFTGEIFKGYGNRSLKALRMLVDAFDDEHVHTLYNAEKECGLANKRLSKDSQLHGNKLIPYVAFDEQCNNPVVLRAMSRMRKIVNAIIGEYGVPDEIHVELGRELKHAKKEREAISKANKRNEADRKWAYSQAEELGYDPDALSSKTITKLLLWKEQNGLDLYRDQPIALKTLIEDDHYCEIDHILPWSRTCDDSRMNKALVLQKSNQDKRQRTPYEWLSETGDWEDFSSRLLSMKSYPHRKKDNMLVTNLDEETADGFITRNLNDTRYASRRAVEYLEHCLEFPDNGRTKHVLCVSGAATSALRHAYGLKTKNRDEDDCHHFIDAAIIAACDQGAVQAVARASERKMLYGKNGEIMLKRQEPWLGFCDKIETIKTQLIPTRMVDHGFTGRLFEDSKYRFEGLDPKTNKGLLTKGGKTDISSNFTMLDEKTAAKIDGQVFLRLWWDPEAKVRGRKEPGRYFAEPVYFADLAAMAKGDYLPRRIPLANEQSPRSSWPVVSSAARTSVPIVIRPGNAVSINGCLYRYSSINISNGQIKLKSMRSKRPAENPPSLSQAVKPNDIFVVDEDLLGRCFGNRDLFSDESTS